MLLLWTLALGSLLVLNCGYAVIGKDGCVVQESLNFEELAVGSVRFKAYVPPNGSIFKAKLTCDGDWHSDSFDVSSNNVTMKSFHGGILNSTVMPAPPAEEGWTDLELKFSDTYELLDGQGQSWIGQEISPKCKLKKVEVSDGKFAKHCPEGTLKWEVEGEKCAFVPLPRSSESHHTLDLTLMSKDSFKPVFHLGGVELELGMREGSVVAEGEGNAPLKPPTQRIRLGLKRRGNNTSFTMTTGESLSSFLHQAVLASETRLMNVCEANDRKFLLTATLEEETGGATGSETAGGAGDVAENFTQGYLFWAILAGLILAAGILTAQVVRLCLLRRHSDEGNARPPQQGPAAAGQGRQPDIDSPYVEPRVLSHWESELSNSSYSGSEHIYEEVDKDAFLSGHVLYPPVTGSASESE